MSLANISPDTDAAAELLGRRKPFGFGQSGPGTGRFDLQSVSDACPLAAPLCSQGTFTIQFDHQTGSVLVSFPQTMQVALLVDSGLHVELKEPIEVTVAGLTSLPSRMRLRKIDIDQADLKYSVDLFMANAWLPAQVALRLEGTCANL